MTEEPRSRRPPLLLAVLTGGLLGLTIGFTDLAPQLRFALDRLNQLNRFPRPVSVDWVVSLRPGLQLLDGLDRPFVSLETILLIAGFMLLGAILAPAFRLLKPPGDNPGAGGSAHLDPPRLARGALGLLLSFWLIGVLAPAAVSLTGMARVPGRAAELLVRLASGPWGWGAHLASLSGPLLQAILLLAGLWVIWGPGGVVTPTEKGSLGRLVGWGALAGVFAYPALLALASGRVWLHADSLTRSLADETAWRAFIRWDVAVPTLATVYLAATPYLFRPRRLPRGKIAGLSLTAAAVCAVSWAVAARVSRDVLQVNAEQAGLAHTLRLPPSSQARYALILTPRGRTLYSLVPDSSDGPDGNDGIACNSHTMKAVRRYLRAQHYAGPLAFRAFTHLNACASVDWDTTWNLQLDLAMLEQNPSPVAGQLLLEKLGECPITPANRAILDRVADPDRFVWPATTGRGWLGELYRRFGDERRALEYLQKADLSPQDFAQVMGGVAPLTDGSVQGRISVSGKPQAGLRVGIVARGERNEWRSLLRMVQPSAWGQVVARTYTDENGAFRIDHLPGGDYVLILTGVGFGKEGAAFTDPPPGLIRLDRFHPVAHLRPFDLQFYQRTHLPPEGEGATA